MQMKGVIVCMLAVVPLVLGMPFTEDEDKLLNMLEKALLELQENSHKGKVVEKRGESLMQLQGSTLQLLRSDSEALLCQGQESNCENLKYRITFRRNEPGYMAVAESAVWGSNGQVTLPLASGLSYDVTACRLQDDGKLQPCERVLYTA